MLAPADDAEHERALVEGLRAPADPQAVAELRRGNPEWDLMRRTFTVLAHANRALAGDDDGHHRAAMDALVAETLADVEAHGAGHFLLPYARARPFRDPAGRSLFVDGEIALMLAAAELAAPDPRRVPALRAHLALIEEQLSLGPAASGESYPDECWTFCNTTALAALTIGDAVLGSDHRPLVERWLEMARARLLSPATGLLASSYTWDGAVIEGPEGSSLWMSAHNLLLLDEDFARDQYRRARAALGFEVLGFGLAREWPRGALERHDVDSGAVIPLLDASAGSSGMALIGAAAFGDGDYFTALGRSLELTAFPSARGGGLHYAAAGIMGNAVIGYAHAAGPLWAAVSRAKRGAT